MSVTIQAESPRSPDATRLIARLADELSARYAEDESRAVFAPEDAEQAGGAFLVARSGDGLAIGCVALRPYEARIGEIKRMFVAPDWRGHKIGRLLLEAIETAARERGYARLVLETGVRQTEAISLYERTGFRHIPAYGHYVGNAISVCFAKELRDLPLSLRPVRARDASSLQAIYNHAVHHTTATMDTEDRSLEEQEAWIAAHDGAPYPGIVAAMDDGEMGETIVGFASLSPFHPRPGYRATVENSLYVHPEWQGRGIGGALLVALLAEARQRGFRTIIAMISADNAPSLHLHRTLGFADAGLLRAVGFKHGQWIDVAYLQYTIDMAMDAAKVNDAKAENEEKP